MTDYSFSRVMRLVCFSCFAALSLNANCAQAQNIAARAVAKVIAAGGLDHGAYHAAVTIDLAPNAITYWRNPGDAGVPPHFDFSGSTNLASAQVSMPAPDRIKEADGVAFGYRQRVVFPVAIIPKNLDAPIHMVLRLDYAVCEKICMPMHLDAALDLQPQAGKTADAAIIAEAETLLPKKSALFDVAELSLVSDAARPTWRLTPRQSGALDLFVDAPPGFFLETQRDGDKAFRLTLIEQPANKSLTSEPVFMTMTTHDGAVEFSAILPR